MDSLSWLLFESFPALAIVLGLLLFGLLVYWRRGGSPRPLLIGAAIAGLLLILQQVVTTPREISDRTLTRIERDVVTGRTAALAEALASEFRAADMDRGAFLEFARTQLERIRVRSVERGELRIENATADRFVADVSYRATIEVRDWGGGLLPTRWRIVFGKSGGTWRIVAIDPPEVAGQKFSDWRALP